MQKIQEKSGIYLLTVDKPEGYEVTEYYGMVNGRAIVGANFVKDFFAKVADTVGGRVSGYEKALDGAMSDALFQMASDAKKLGANAVLGVQVNCVSMGPRMLMVTCIGTAAVVRQG